MADTRTMGRIHTVGGTPAAVIAGQRVELLDRARVYACGITPYDVTHLGHAAAFAWVDTLGRTLRFLGVEPEVCRNVTDVDDVLDAAAGRAGTAYDTFAAIQQFQFERDMAALNVRAPEHEPRAHRYVEQVIRLASGLLDAGAAYAREGSVYFRGGDVAGRAGLERAEAIRPAGRTTRPRTIRWTRPSGRPARRAIRPGTRPGGRAGPAGTPSAPPWRCRCSGPRSTSTPAARTCGFRTMPTTRPWPRRSPASGRTRGPGCTWERSPSAARRWPSRPGTWCCWKSS